MNLRRTLEIVIRKLSNIEDRLSCDAPSVSAQPKAEVAPTVIPTKKEFKVAEPEYKTERQGFKETHVKIDEENI